MAGLALDVLDLCFIRVNIPVAHGFGPRMAINAVQCVFAFCKLSDGLIVIMQTIDRLVGALNERHRAQIIVTAVVTGIALCIGNGSCQLMYQSFWKGVDVWCMTCSATVQAIEFPA